MHECVEAQIQFANKFFAGPSHNDMAFAASSHTEELDEPPGLPDKLKESFSGPILLKLGQRMNPEDAKYLRTEFGVTVHSRPSAKAGKPMCRMI